MKLPEHLEFVEDDTGVKIFGGIMGPYTIYIRDKRTHKITRIQIPYPPLDQENLPQFFIDKFKAALKEQLNEDIECRQPDSEHDSDVREKDSI